MIIALVRKPPRELNNFVFKQQQNLGRRFSASKMYLRPLVAYAADRSKAVVLFWLKYCLINFPLFVGVMCLCLF